MLSGLAFWLMGRESAKSFLQTNYKKAMIKEKLLVVPARSLEEAGTVMSEYWEKDGEEPMLEGFRQMF